METIKHSHKANTDGTVSQVVKTDWEHVYRPVYKSGNKWLITVEREENDGVVRYYTEVVHRKTGEKTKQYLLAFMEHGKDHLGILDIVPRV